jgi:ABC-type uncharacterized transport system YnjBCD substrate-binding protein
MAKAKKSEKSEDQKNDASVAEARPVGMGKDPLAEGNTLVNPSNSEAETHYEVKQRSADVQASEINGQNANERAEEHNTQSLPASEVPNSDQDEQDEVAESRTEK